MSEGPLATSVLSVRTNRVGRLARRPSFSHRALRRCVDGRRFQEPAVHAHVERREQVEAREVSQPHEVEARPVARRSHGRKRPRLLQWSARVPAARANLSDARTVGRPPTTATALNQVRGSRGRSLECREKWEKSWPEGQVVESGSETPPAAVPSVAIATAAAATTTTAAAEGPELELSVPSAAAAASLAAVAAASIAGFALVLDRANVEGGVHRLDRLVRLRHRAILADVQPDVAAHEGHVAVVD